MSKLTRLLMHHFYMVLCDEEHGGGRRVTMKEPERVALFLSYMLEKSQSRCFSVGRSWRDMPSQGYVRFPTIYRDRVVFVAEDDLWQVSSEGGRAERLT